MSQLKRAVIVLSLMIFGAMFLTVAGLWPVDTYATTVCALTGWAAWILALWNIGRLK